MWAESNPISKGLGENRTATETQPTLGVRRSERSRPKLRSDSCNQGLLTDCERPRHGGICADAVQRKEWCLEIELQSELDQPWVVARRRDASEIAGIGDLTRVMIIDGERH